MIKIEPPEIPKQNQNKPEQKKDENSKEANPAKKEMTKEERRKLRGKRKSLMFIRRLLNPPKNTSTLQEVYQSLETNKTFEMSTLKNPPNFSDDRIYMENKEEEEQPKKKKHVNYPLSAIGLLKCDYGNGLIVYGTGTLISLNMVLTCAHVLFSPILKRRCNKVTFYMNLSNGKYLDESDVETFAIPDEYEYNSQDEQHDFALCVLKEDIGKKGGFLGVCTYDEKEDKNGYIFGYANIKKTRNFVSSFKTKMTEYEMMGVKTSLRYIEEEKELIYVGNKTKEGQDGSPIFKVVEDVKKHVNEKLSDKEKIKKGKKQEMEEKMNTFINNILGNFDKRRNSQKYDVKIFAIDCSITRMSIQNVDSVMLNNNENVNLNEMVYLRHHKALVIDENKLNTILRWMHFYEDIMPKGKIDQHIKTTKSIYNELMNTVHRLSGNVFDLQNKQNKILAINCCDIRGKDVQMLLNSQFDICQLTILDLSNNSINYEGIHMLAYQEGFCYHLIELNLAENMLDYRAARYLSEVEFNALDKLNISKNNIGPLGATVLAEKGKFPNLRELNVGENNLGREGSKGLANGDTFKNIVTLYIEGNDINDDGLHYLSIGKLSNISELYLGKNKIGDDGIIYVINFKNLEILDLDWNYITFKGIHCICGQYFKNIQKLNLNNNKIGIEGTYIIASQQEHSLTSLSLVRNGICTKGAELISIMNLESINDLNISDNFINDLGFFFLCKGKLKNLKRLDVSLNRLTDKGLVYITEANFIDNLTYLNLAGNDITDDGVKYVTFCKMSNLQTLDLTLNYLKAKTGSHLSKSFFHLLSDLSLERNKIKAHGLKNLIGAKFFINLTKLNLAYTKIGNEGCQILSESPVSNIEVLNLKDNSINDEGVIVLCKGKFDNLKDLNLEDNDIAKKGVDVIVDTIIKRLKFLRLKGNKRIDNNDVMKIQDSCDSKFEKDHNYTFVNFSQVNYGAIRYCIRHPEFMENAKY